MTAPRVEVPPLCSKHQRRVVTRLAVGPEGPWRAALLVTNMLLFQRASQDIMVHKRAGNRVEELSLVLAEIGCLACRYRNDFELALTFQKEESGMHVADVIYARAASTKWPWGLYGKNNVANVKKEEE